MWSSNNRVSDRKVSPGHSWMASALGASWEGRKHCVYVGTPGTGSDVASMASMTPSRLLNGAVVTRRQRRRPGGHRCVM